MSAMDARAAAAMVATATDAMEVETGAPAHGEGSSAMEVEAGAAAAATTAAPGARRGMGRAHGGLSGNARRKLKKQQRRSGEGQPTR